MTSHNDFLIAMERWAGIYMFQSLVEFFNFLKHAELSLHQAYALTFVFYNGPSKISDLCEHMMVSAAAASQMVDRLEKQNLVIRQPDPEDRRIRNVVLTSEGESFVQKSIEARQSWVKALPASLTEEEQEQITAALQILINRSVVKIEPERA